MAEERSQRVPAENISSSDSAREPVICEQCGSERVHRILREGFWQQKVYPCFGCYPWRCTECGRLTLRRKRHRMKTP